METAPQPASAQSGNAGAGQISHATGLDAACSGVRASVSRERAPSGRIHRFVFACRAGCRRLARALLTLLLAVSTSQAGADGTASAGTNPSRGASGTPAPRSVPGAPGAAAGLALGEHWYRVACFPPFADNLVFVLNVEDSGAGTLLTRRSRKPWKSPERLISSWRRNMTQAQVSEFLQLMDEADFWNMARPDPSRPEFDGMGCVVEAHRGSQVHVVERHHPPPALGKSEALLLKAAGLASWGYHRPLSQFELWQLEFLATRRNAKGGLVALVRAPDGVTEVVKSGDGVGADLGVVDEITRDYIKISEAELDCESGELRERDNYLPRVGAAVEPRFSMIVGPSEVQGRRIGRGCVFGAAK